MRAIVVLPALALQACVGVTLGPWSSAETADCAGRDAGPDVGPLTCDEPAEIRPDDVVDLASFRRIASEALCEIGLRCGMPAEQAYCHPQFAARIEARNGLDASAFDPTVARACVRGLLRVPSCSAAIEAADACEQLEVVGGYSAAPPTDGMPCTSSCAFDSTCVGGVCVAPGGPGAACDVGRPCDLGLRCTAGACALAAVGESCGIGAECERGLGCAYFSLLSGTCASCDANAPPTVRHVGCACTSDDECPSDVARCVGGVCALRPFPGDPCADDALPCYESHCEAGRCELLASGEGPCGRDGDCAVGLSCSALAPDAAPGLCGPARAIGDPCGLRLPGGCGGSYCDGSFCRPFVSRGGRCSEVPRLLCAPSLTCTAGVCA